MNDRPPFATMLRLVRKIADVSQAELALRCGGTLTLNRVHKIERGTSAPRPAEIVRFAEVLNRVELLGFLVVAEAQPDSTTDSTTEASP